MMKKSEEARREIQRPKKKKARPKKTHLESVNAALPSERRKRGVGHTDKRNPSQHAKRKATFALEDSATGRPSRKSSRAGANRSKSDSNLRRRQTRRTTSAKTRASRGK